MSGMPENGFAELPETLAAPTPRGWVWPAWIVIALFVAGSVFLRERGDNGAAKAAPAGEDRLTLRLAELQYRTLVGAAKVRDAHRLLPHGDAHGAADLDQELPGDARQYPGGQRRGDGGAQSRSGMRDALREATFGGEHPARQRSSGNGERTGFADAKNEADGNHGCRAPGERGEGGEYAPPGDDNCEGAARADLVAEPGARELKKGEAQPVAG